eukprot:CAMPEP_0177626322 /NCGR_PEP_ID=MMETSP0419_2-20121207/30587_1 /TAXON_ID=582737 /ORGANISM="Tetraselmis sp., Strain GSL018" /LENGTH=187 /DNA_ID=CAMNT_0019127359 /DNA_START=42 /DNA_END=602 /DNA_ORIENTATION=+
MAKSIACITLMSAVLLAYGVRCSIRNRDWESDEALFLQAATVCRRSAKVQLNLGILARRKFQWMRALDHFHQARTIEPTYCEPTYWYGLTLINQGQNMDRGIRELEKSIGCKYVAADAVQALNTIYKVMHENNPLDGRPFEACGMLEQAALLAALGPLANISKAKSSVNVCLKAQLPPKNSGLLLPA